MLKKILILFLSAHLCAAEDIEKPDLRESNTDLRESNNRSATVIGLGLIALVVYMISPKLLECLMVHSILPKLLEGLNNQHITTCAGAALVAYSLNQLRNSNVSTNETKMSPAEAHEIYERLTAKRAFRSCLMENAKAPRNEAGIPINCEACGDNFAATAGMEAFREMVETFKEVY